MPSATLADLVTSAGAIDASALLVMVGGVFIVSWGLKQIRKFGIRAN